MPAPCNAGTRMSRSRTTPGRRRSAASRRKSAAGSARSKSRKRPSVRSARSARERRSVPPRKLAEKRTRNVASEQKKSVESVPRRQTDVQGAAVELLLEVTAGDDPEREEVARLAVPGTIGAREESQPRTARAAQLVAMLVEGIRKAVPTRTIGAGPMQMNLEEMPGEMPPLNARSRGDPPAPRARAVTEKTQAHGDLHARARAVRSGRSQEPLQAERAVAAVAAMMMQAAGADRLEGAARTPTAGDATTLREGRGRSARRMVDFAVLILAERRSPLTKALAELHLVRKHVHPRERNVRRLPQNLLHPNPRAATMMKDGALLQGRRSAARQPGAVRHPLRIRSGARQGPVVVVAKAMETRVTSRGRLLRGRAISRNEMGHAGTRPAEVWKAVVVNLPPGSEIPGTAVQTSFDSEVDE